VVKAGKREGVGGIEWKVQSKRGDKKKELRALLVYLPTLAKLSLCKSAATDVCAGSPLSRKRAYSRVSVLPLNQTSETGGLLRSHGISNCNCVDKARGG